MHEHEKRNEGRAREGGNEVRGRGAEREQARRWQAADQQENTQGRGVEEREGGEGAYSTRLAAANAAAEATSMASPTVAGACAAFVLPLEEVLVSVALHWLTD